jgi:hypothetical protein
LYPPFIFNKFDFFNNKINIGAPTSEVIIPMGNSAGANNNLAHKSASVRSIAYLLLGHEIHHRTVIEKKYLL